LKNRHSAGLSWTGDRPVARACACKTPNVHKRQTSMILVG